MYYFYYCFGHCVWFTQTFGSSFPFVFIKVFLEWKVISFTIREKIFAVDEEDQIDIHDVKVH